MHNNSASNVLSLGLLSSPAQRTAAVRQPVIVRRIWLKVPHDSHLYLCAQKLGGDNNSWRIAILKPIHSDVTGRPCKFRRQAFYADYDRAGRKITLFGYERMMDILWSYFDPAVYDVLRNHKDHFVQEMARFVLNHDLEDKNRAGFVVRRHA